MWFSWFRRHRKEPAHPASTPPTQVVTEPTPMTSTVDLTLPRRVFYRTIDPALSLACPRCKTTLTPEKGLYFVSTRQGRRQGDDFMISGDFGFYCSTCPTVVIDREQLGHCLQIGAYKWDVGDIHMVRGLIDTEAIPEDQSDLPFDELDAIPLVPFVPGDRPRQSSKQRRRKTKSKRQKRR